MLSREKEALFYDRRVILYSVQVFGSLGRNGVKNTCTAILGVFFIDFNPSLGLSLWFSWWWMVLPFMTYHLLYWFEKAISSHSVFNWEALTYCGDAVYMRKRKSYAWMKWYGKKTFPKSEWED